VDPLPTTKCDGVSGQWYSIGLTTITCTATDHTGNSKTATFTITVQDTTAPTIVLTKPVAATYRVGQKVTANFTCTDAGAGIQSCIGTAADGASINTATAGTLLFTVVATDKSGNIATASVTYIVR